MLGRCPWYYCRQYYDALEFHNDISCDTISPSSIFPSHISFKSDHTSLKKTSNIKQLFNYFKFYFVVYSEMIMVNTKVNTIRVTLGVTCLKSEVLSKLSWKIHFMSPQITQNNHHKCKFECPMQKMIIQFTFKTSKKMLIRILCDDIYLGQNNL